MRRLVRGLAVGVVSLFLVVPSVQADGYVSGFYRNYIDTYKRDYSVNFNYKYPVLSQTYQDYNRRGDQKNGLDLSCGPTALLLAKNHKDRSFTYSSNKNIWAYKRAVHNSYRTIPRWLENIMKRPTDTNHNTNARELEYMAKSYGVFRNITSYTSSNTIELFKKLNSVVSMGYMGIVYLSSSASRLVNQTGYTHAVIVYAINNRYVYYIDPWDGRRKRVSRMSFQNSLDVVSKPNLLSLK